MMPLIKWNDDTHTATMETNRGEFPIRLESIDDFKRLQAIMMESYRCGSEDVTEIFSGWFIECLDDIKQAGLGDGSVRNDRFSKHRGVK